MTLNKIEHGVIYNSELPSSWKLKENINEFECFLQENWNLRELFYYDSVKESKQQFIKFLGNGNIKMNSYVGTIFFKGEQLNIFPKVFQYNNNEVSNLNTNHLFLNIINWIGYSNKRNFPFISSNIELGYLNNLEDLFETLFINMVVKAVHMNIYTNYIMENEVNGKVGGRIDFKDYLNKKIPQAKWNSFNQIKSSLNINNKINQIIKYVCYMLYPKSTVKNKRLINLIFSYLEDVSLVKMTPNDCLGLHFEPKYKNYNIIIGMCRMLLLKKISEGKMGNNKSFCLLFPMNLLFEGFIGGITKKAFIDQNIEIKLQESSSILIDEFFFNGISKPAFQLKHDIFLKYKQSIIIMDTKYKNIPRFENNSIENIIKNISQPDLYQMVSYSLKKGARELYLIYPLSRFEKNEPSFPYGYVNTKTEKIKITFIRVPFVFEKDNEELLINDLSFLLRNIILNNDK